ncbi:hypothetical protein E2562_017619 [Oryza meyeriana var. granulata]|uniref:Uncharacterized protein n=1 Tax=Oryza meyeriana var. granulata TaxID=110450 RepID=A0A6G1BXA3_9ORYZ|nr:hypothetical protein E2562_017619 [Oryza meyeriana var. granulata]
MAPTPMTAAAAGRCRLSRGRRPKGHAVGSSVQPLAQHTQIADRRCMFRRATLASSAVILSKLGAWMSSPGPPAPVPRRRSRDSSVAARQIGAPPAAAELAGLDHRPPLPSSPPCKTSSVQSDVGTVHAVPWQGPTRRAELSAVTGSWEPSCLMIC